MVLGSTAASRLQAKAAVYAAGTCLTLVVGAYNRFASNSCSICTTHFASLCVICNAKWPSISCNNRYALGGSVAMAARQAMWE